MQTTAFNRAEILEEISQLEFRLAELRALLPTAIKTFYRFRCRPEQFVWVYAATRQKAETRLHERMNRDYSEGWSIASKVVDEFTEPENAAANTPGSLFRSLSEDQAREFLADWKSDQKGRGAKSKLQHTGKSQLEQDAEAFEKYLRQSK